MALTLEVAADHRAVSSGAGVEMGSAGWTQVPTAHGDRPRAGSAALSWVTGPHICARGGSSFMSLLSPPPLHVSIIMNSPCMRDTCVHLALTLLLLTLRIFITYSPGCTHTNCIRDSRPGTSNPRCPIFPVQDKAHGPAEGCSS